ncbi:MAG: SRPBCC domain-containing protein [Nocardioidaceae bacterium]
MTITETVTTTQVYRVYIKATPEAIWDAITRPEWTARYGYTGYVDYDLRPGGHYLVRPTEGFREASEASGHPIPDVVIDGEVLEADPPRKLVTTFRMLMDPEIAAEPPSRITHEIRPAGDGVCCLTLTHELENSPRLAAIVSGSLEEFGAGGGHAWVLSDLKSLLETGSSFES